MKRLFLRSRLAAGMSVDLDRGQANYMINVLRMEPGATIAVFNGKDGEWEAALRQRDRRGWALSIVSPRQDQTEATDLRYIFAPLKQARLDYMVQKAVEMGAGALTPVLTHHGQVSKVNKERMEANAIEAAEQCGLLTIPRVDEPVQLFGLIEGWPAQEPNRRIVYCDEELNDRDPIAALAGIKEAKLAVLIGPEGGFSPDERSRLRSRPFVTSIGLGPRILRADTAAVAALALIQAVAGDWRSKGDPAAAT